MSIKSFDDALDVLPASRTESADQPRFLNKLAVVFAAIRDGLAAAHDYETLIGQGVPADKAVKQVFESRFADR